MADALHRAILHSRFGIFLCEPVLGTTLTNSSGKVVSVRAIGEQHVKVGMGGRIPSVQDWLQDLPPKMWMAAGTRLLSRELEGDAEAQVQLEHELKPAPVGENRG